MFDSEKTPPHILTEQEMLELSPWDFDQAPNGWRSLTNPNDPQSNLHAVRLIRQYMAENRERIANQSIDKPILKPEIMQFHIGQLLANSSSEHYPEAMESFAQSYHIDPEDPWNYYVDATIGFLKKDVEGIKASLEQIEAVPSANPYKMSGNESVVKRLITALESGITDYSKV